MENRESMVFYKSFYDCVQMIPEDKPELKVQMYDLIFKYQFYGEEMEVDWQVAMAWPTIKAQIIANIQRRENGHKGGRPPKNNESSYITEKPHENKNITKPKPNVNVNDNDNVNENNNANDNDNDNENVNAYLDDSSEAVKYYLDFVNPKATKPIKQAIEKYIKQGMTEGCLIAIFDYCLSRDRDSWSYIEKVIKNKLKQGVVTSDEFEQSNEEYTANKATAPPKKKSPFHNMLERDINCDEIEADYFKGIKESDHLE